VLDNGSSDDTGALLRRLAAADPDHVIPRYVPENLGTTRSRNMLCAAAQGDYLCIMDSDVELSAGVTEALVAMLNGSRTHLGIVVPRVCYPNGAWQKSFDRFPTILDKVDRFFRLRGIEARQGRELERVTDPFYVDYAISAFWLMRRDLFDTVGMLDEHIFYALEDVDFCLRVWQAGHRILYVPSVSVVHHSQEISRGLNLTRAKFSHIKGLIYYFLKHRYLLRRPEFSVGSPAEMIS
jgi:GT2 family glycosyltransferase